LISCCVGTVVDDTVDGDGVVEDNGKVPVGSVVDPAALDVIAMTGSDNGRDGIWMLGRSVELRPPAFSTAGACTAWTVVICNSVSPRGDSSLTADDALDGNGEGVRSGGAALDDVLDVDATGLRFVSPFTLTNGAPITSGFLFPGKEEVPIGG
jgi:hypothetical protein